MSRKWKWRIAALMLPVLMVALGIGAVYAEWSLTRSRGEARRDEVVRKLDAEEPGWRAAELCVARNAALPPDDQNPAIHAVALLDKLPPAYKEWTLKRNQEGWESPPAGVLFDPDDLCEMCAVHLECEGALEKARQLRTMRGGGFRLVFAEPNPMATLLPNTQKMLETATILQMDATVLAHTDRPDAAIESAHAILNTGRALGDEPTLISQLVRIAIAVIAVRSAEQTLGVAEPTRGLAELQAAFTEEITVPRLSYGFRGERASHHMLLEGVDSGLVSLSELSDSGRASFKERMMTRFYRKHVPAQQALMAEIMTRLLEAVKLDGPARAAAIDVEMSQIPPSRYEYILARLLLPAFQKMVAADDRVRANLACAAVALACERYRLQFGHYPGELEAIPKSLLDRIPHDPFTGTPLLYRRTETGAVVYTTGPDCVDDGGNLSVRVEPGTDLGFRLFEPAHRRQPPLPKPPPLEDLPDEPQ